MSDIIQLLPDSVANQIAAGEVIQRPASAVKELLENSIDANSTHIQLILKDAGRTLIQVIDNGIGMSPTDARMCFERHATSKLKTADDLFNIRTKGFRGEALASIAAVAQVELKTMRSSDEIGTKIIIEGSEVKSQEPCHTSKGTSIAVKNLFFNVPARRNFLKSNQVEFRHIMDEFQRVALIHPEVSFELYHNDHIQLSLERGNFKQRIVGLMGNNYNERLVPVEEQTEIVKISGYVCKPEFAKKTRGEQFLFVNQRFIKSNYLHHAIQHAFEDLIPHDSHASYFIQLEVNPASIDVNIHPTKTEVKFEDEKAIYAILRTAVKQSLGKYQIAPTLDFEVENSFTLPHNYEQNEVVIPKIKVNPNYNPFERELPLSFNGNPIPKDKNVKHWEKLYPSQSDFEKIKNTEQETIEQLKIEHPLDKESNIESRICYQLHRSYIITQIKSGMMIIDQQLAHERILYEEFCRSLAMQKSSCQQLLFPQTVELSSNDTLLLNEVLEDLKNLGFDISPFGNNTFVINGIPSGASEQECKNLLEEILESYRLNTDELKFNRQQKLALALAKNIGIKRGKVLNNEEMNALIDLLFACEVPNYTVNGKIIVQTITLEEIAKKFQR
ncbi:MAG: DNA mismatch repair endonuclease MutL [Bacteroidia bacterium]